MWLMEYLSELLWPGGGDAEFGPLALYGVSVGIQWLRFFSFLLVQRELGQVRLQIID
jgi:hypothetical protein